MVTSVPLFQHSATQLAAALRDGMVSAVDAVFACFDRIDSLNPSLNAFITLCREQAEQEAIAADKARKQGQILGPLHGIPIAIKDLNATAGIRTTYGSKLFENHIPDDDDLCVARLKAAGAIIVGKTSTPEFGFGTGTHNPLIGTTVNPYNPNYTCGDSSGGSAVVVATGMSFLAHGGDMGGSVRTPASFCNIVGLRPAIGRIPRVPKPLLWECLATDGVLARTVEDAALMLSVMAGWDAGDPVSIAQSNWSIPDFSLNGQEQTRVGYSMDLGVTLIHQEVTEVFEAAVRAIDRPCSQVKPAHPDCAGAQATFATLRAALVYQMYYPLLERYGEQLTDTVRWEIEQGNGVTAAQYLQAEAQRGHIYQNFVRFFENYDVLIVPSASVPPFPVSQTEVREINGIPLQTIIDYLAITYIISLTGLPALSIPCGYTKSGLPIGIQLVGKPQGEAALLQFAYFLQETLNFRHCWS
ncbi:amidase [Phormidium tenue FACHB-886]|nr:amidase [Phormidium tenue FACHB-886]